MKPILILTAALLVGCQTKPVIPTEVKIPIAIPCKVETPTEPDYQFSTLTPDDTIWTKVLIMLSDRQLSIAYETELKAALAACK